MEETGKPGPPVCVGGGGAGDGEKGEGREICLVREDVDYQLVAVLIPTVPKHTHNYTT